MCENGKVIVLPIFGSENPGLPSTSMAAPSICILRQLSTYDKHQTHYAANLAIENFEIIHLAAKQGCEQANSQ